MTAATLISVDFKQRKVVGRKSLTVVADKKPGIDIAQNKRLINDLKAMLDDIVDQVDLYDAILFIPDVSNDLFTKINGTEIAPTDIAAIERIHRKLRQSNVKP